MRHPREEFSLRDSIAFLSKSGISEYVLKAKVVRGYCDVEYSAIRVGVNRSKHRNVVPDAGKPPRYFEFVKRHFNEIIGLVDDNRTSGVRLTSKSIQLTEDARSKFLQGWEIVQERLKSSEYDVSSRVGGSFNKY